MNEFWLVLQSISFVIVVIIVLVLSRRKQCLKLLFSKKKVKQQLTHALYHMPHTHTHITSHACTQRRTTIRNLISVHTCILSWFTSAHVESCFILFNISNIMEGLDCDLITNSSICVKCWHKRGTTSMTSWANWTNSWKMTNQYCEKERKENNRKTGKGGKERSNIKYSNTPLPMVQGQPNSQH